MELASMLAGERFNDHPESVSPVIGAFLRAYNDLLDDSRRQDLYRYAAKCVGTADGVQLERLRAQRLTEWAEAARERHWPATVLHRFRCNRVRGKGTAAAARHAIQAIGLLSDSTHRAVLTLVDELVSMRIDAWSGLVQARGTEPEERWGASQVSEPSCRRTVRSEPARGGGR
jgi:hypothetical protein